ncbi:MAG: glycosyltransferase family 2 protein [Erysipelotrichaceae bacterium]|nr:glycosyltransferase family 2 protein [Erysipelotrichaceae bacterium]
MNDIITIVVPVYNTYDYLDKCLDSLIYQTYKDLKIICVDDGSTDNSKEIIDSYIVKDNRISYVYQENGGAAAARNHGIDLFVKDESSEYIIFVDSDDIVENDFVETLYNTLKEYDADIATCNMKPYGDKTQGNKETSVYNRQEVLVLYFKDQVFLETPVCKIYKKKMFDEIRFPDGKHYEDTFATYKFIEKTDKVSHIDYYSYQFVIREGSLTHSDYSDYEYDKVEAGREIADYYKNTDFERISYNKYLGILFYFIIKTNKNRNKVNKNEVALNEAKEIVNKNGFRQADLRFIPFIIATKLNLLRFISI